MERLAFKKKREYAAESDWVAAYGWPPGLTLTFDRAFGLYLNVGRQYARGAWQHADAAALAAADDAPALPWFEALAATDEEAKARHAAARQAAVDRSIRRLMAMRPLGGF